MNIKNLIVKNKRIAICLVVALGIGVTGGASNMSQAEYNNLVVQKQQLDSEIATLDKQLEENKAQVDDLQAKKDEANRIAKAEAEKLAKEEADRIVQAQEQAQQQENSQPATENVRTVWVANATTEVYHSSSSCSNMKSPSEITYEDAQARGLRPCKKC